MTMARLALLMSLALLAATTANAASKPARGGKSTTPAASSGAVVVPGASGSSPASGSSTGAQPPSTPGPGAAAKAAPRDSGYTIPAGQEGAVFRSLTVEGEDRVHFEFERPALALDLDPNSAPGLDWGSARDVLNRTVPDLGAPLLASSSQQPTPHLAHPWLGHFVTGSVARFRPDVQGVERWKLTIVDARGQTVASYEGRGDPPREIGWDGRTQGGGLVVPGITYSYVMEARDRAGNKRNFVGQGFQVSAYRLASLEDPMMVFSGRELPSPDPTRPAPGPTEKEATAPILIEAAGWLNQSPKAVQAVRVTATARSNDQAQSLCALVVRQMTPHLLGDPVRIQAVAEVQPDAPERGAVRISTGR